MEHHRSYCVRCREMRSFDGEVVDLANGRRVALGTCSTCGTPLTTVLSRR